MTVANTTADIGKELENSVKQGCHAGNTSLQVHPHPNPKNIAYYEDAVLERK